MKNRAGMASSNEYWSGDTLTDILMRLPVKSIIRFKCVSKTWCNLIQHPRFVSQHLGITKKKKRLLVFYNEAYKKGQKSLRLFDYKTFVSYHDDLRQLLPNDFHNEYISFCVCNGLLCLLASIGSSFGSPRIYFLTLWNPATREIRILPECDKNIPPRCKWFTHALGFGLDPLSNDYKVIFIQTYVDRERMRRRHIATYKMSTDSWRVLEDEDVQFFEDLHICPNYNNACGNGICYWQVWERGMINYQLLAFDLRAEVFQLIQSPISRCGKLLPFHDNRISIWDTESIGRSNEIWVLNDERQWTKLLKIDPLLGIERMFGFWEDGNVFVESESGELLLYNLDTKEFSNLGIKARKVGDLDVYTYEESLVAIGRE